MKTFPALLLLSAVLLLSGCTTYTPPSGRADFDAFISDTDQRMRDSFAAQPAAGFPAHLVFARVQAPSYHNHRTRHEGGVYHGGRYSVFTTREVEDEADFVQIEQLPDVGSVGSFNRLLLDGPIETEHDLRLAAARLKADMLVLYTFETSFHAREKPGPLKTITLGHARTRELTLNVSASALVLDTRTGFIYAALESNERRALTTNLWRQPDDADYARRDAEKAAFKKLTGEFLRNWARIAARARQGA